VNSDSPGANPPGEVPPRRRLDRPPSERFGPPATPPDVDPGASESASSIAQLHGTGPALAVAALGAVALIVLYGVLATTIGLLAIAGGTGFVVGLALRGGDGAAGRAALITVAALLLGIVGSWAVSLAEGGVASPVDYIGQTLGPLAVIVPIVGAAAAWLGSR
jgi:hypothetical protein